MTTRLIDIPEIRSRLALFVSVKDALSCIQVSKLFYQDFIYSIWHTIDFETQISFTKIDPDIVDKNGHHIRVVKGVRTHEQLLLILRLNINNLSSLHVKTEIPYRIQSTLNNILKRNQNSLTEFELRNELTTREFLCLDTFISSTSSPSQPSKLTSITIRRLTFPRRSLTRLLRCCPKLEAINLWGTTTLPHTETFDDYQHMGVKTLQSQVAETVAHKYPLFLHFPNLKKWRLYHDSSPSEFPTQAVKDGLSKWCPSLDSIETNYTPSPLIPHLLVNVFTGVTSLMFEYKYIDQNLVNVLVKNPNWKELMTYTSGIGFYSRYEDDGVSELDDHFEHSRDSIQDILRSSHKLVTFIFPSHEMDMDDIEQAPWACSELECVRVRIKGLDTRKKIEGVIAKWREARKTSTAEPSTDDCSIEDRVVRHLLKFNKLNTIWLGSKRWAF
ncbi:hypothetical protein BGZ76_008682 [Entomortierella beljakovae]|nr:hypothetical protein BGZ76_008682 [Entomortierella beljakovae]